VSVDLRCALGIGVLGTATCLAVLGCGPSSAASRGEARAPVTAPVQAERVDQATLSPQAAANHSDTLRSFTVLAVNDLYRIAGLLPSERGGLARLRTLRRVLERSSDVLFLHAGDALFPSLLSREFDGAQMIDVLNLMDGAEDAWDANLIAVYGNHEFDDNELEDVPAFESRMRESDFVWLRTNLEFPSVTSEGGRVVKVAEDALRDVMRRSVIVERGGLNVGVFGLTRSVADVEYVRFEASDAELMDHMQEATRDLRSRGADVVIALTHLDLQIDQLLAAEADPGPDFIIGGHEHNAQQLRVNNRWILKADADGITATVAVVRVGPNGVSVTPRLDTIGPGSYRADPLVHARVESWLARFERVFCRDQVGTRRCLDDPVTVLGEDAVAEEVLIRSQDTNVGRWVATLMHDAGAAFVRRTPTLASDVPLVAFINSGAIRLNQTLREGETWQRRHTEELNQFPETLHLLRLEPAQLQAVLNHSVACRGGGPWLQVAGMTFSTDGSAGLARDVRVAGVPLSELEEPVLAVTGSFLAREDSPGDQDGYMFGIPQYVAAVTLDDRPVSVRALVEASLEAASEGTMRFPSDTRISTPEGPAAAGPCPTMTPLPDAP